MDRFITGISKSPEVLAMIVTVVDIYVKSERIDEFIEATTLNHKSSAMEEGNLRFDFLQDRSRPNHFLLYEAYESEEAAAQHKKTDHYLKWKSTVEGWMERPRTGTQTNVIEPSDAASWKR
jgi:autoinducer 2-degrading protein